jgi:diguanylate cyclase (GGDEF)-like protein
MTSETLSHLIQFADVALNREHNYAKAMEYIEEALKLDPKSARAHLLKGVCELNLGLTPKAVQSFDTVVKLEPDNVEALLNLAYINIEAGDHDTAKEYIGRVLSKSNVSEAFELLGDMSQKREQFQDAIDAYERATNLAPSRDNLYFKRSICHYKLGQYKDAFRNAEIAIELNPAHPEAKTLADMSADQHLYGHAGFMARLFVRPFRAIFKKQLKEQIEINEDLKRIKRQAEELSIDPLMKIRNRAYFMNRLPILCEHAKKNAQPIALLFFDLDHMKMYNETYGHKVLDQALSLVGDAFNKSITDGDVAARYGGDEFVIVLANCDKERAQTVLTGLQTELNSMNANKLPALGIKKPITFSIGLAAAPVDMETSAEAWPDQLINKSDLAALWAKHHGRNQTCVYDLARKDEFELVEKEVTKEAKQKASKGERP